MKQQSFLTQGFAVDWLCTAATRHLLSDRTPDFRPGGQQRTSTSATSATSALLLKDPHDPIFRLPSTFALFLAVPVGQLLPLQAKWVFAFWKGSAPFPARFVLITPV